MRRAARMLRAIGRWIPILGLGVMVALEGFLLRRNAALLFGDFLDDNLARRCALITAAVVALLLPLAVAAWRYPRDTVAAAWLKSLAFVLLIDPLGLLLVLTVGDIVHGGGAGIAYLLLPLALFVLVIIYASMSRWGGAIFVAAGVGLALLFFPAGIFEFGPLVLTGLCFLAAARRQSREKAIESAEAAEQVTPRRGMLDALPPRALRILAGVLSLLAVIGPVAQTAAPPGAAGRDDSASFQLGFVGMTVSGTPTPVRTASPDTPLGGVSTIASGSAHTLALKRDGTVWAWGNNHFGQLGDGTTNDRDVPAMVLLGADRPLDGVTAIAVGLNHNLALRADGTVWTWGEDWVGELGNGALVLDHPVPRPTPARVDGLSDVTAVAAGQFFSLAVRSDGTVWAWGDNLFGQLGDGTTANRALPGRVPGLNGIVAVAGGDGHTLALGGDGTIWAWGDNRYGQLGDGTRADRSFPARVAGVSDVVAVAAGGSPYSVAITRDGSVWAWGGDARNLVGVPGACGTTPARADALAGTVAVATTNNRGIALLRDGTLLAWGDNHFGQVGDGTTGARRTPVRVLVAPGQPLDGVVAIAASQTLSLAVRSDGTVWWWGAAPVAAPASGAP